jgi:membrane protein
MASPRSRAGARFTRLRERSEPLDHVARTVTHYTRVEGNAQAGAVTFYGFLSFFPLLALAFFFVGLLAGTFPDLDDAIAREVERLLPGVVGDDPGEIQVTTFEKYAATVGLLGLAGLLYSGLGWLSAMRNALQNVFVLPRREQPGYLVGKAHDLAALTLIGLTLLVSIALSSAVAGFSGRLLTWAGLDPDAFLPTAGLWAVGLALGVAVSTVLLLTMFRLLASPHVPRGTLVRGAVVGAVGFELLKALATYLIGLTKQSPSFQAFGVSLVLLVWIGYFSRLVMFTAAFTYTARPAVELRAQDAAPPTEAPAGSTAAEHPEPGAAPAARAAAPVAPGPVEAAAGAQRRTLLVVAAGSAVLGAAVGAVARSRLRRGRMGS